jgi:multidrug efflux pump subunit AcrA (membrane-fusion protein)
VKKSAALIIITIIFGSCGNDVTRVQPEISTLTESVYASGTIEAEGQFQLNPEVNGLLREIYVSEGDTVRPGDRLFLIENQTSLLNTENANLALSLSEKNRQEDSHRLTELKLAVDHAKENLEMDSLLYIRQKKLWDQNIGSQLTYEQRKLSFEASRVNYKSAKARLEQAKEEFEIEYLRARNNLKINQEAEDNYTIRSEIEGLVYDILYEKGEWVSPQGPLAVMGNPKNYLLSLLVDEYDIAKIRSGQKVLVNMDSYRGEVFHAKVSKVYPIMDARSRTFTVEAVFIDPPPGLYPNLTAEANIVIQTKENALIIPREYLIEDQFVLTGPEERVNVEVGLMDYQNVEILDGLDQDQFIYKP